MANYERGVYEPSDEVRVYDGSEEEDEAEGSRLPLLIVLAIIVISAFGGVVYYAYSQGVARGRGETPVLAAAAGPDKIAPQSPGGSETPYQGFKIYEQPAPPDDQAEAAAAPAPATPAPDTAMAQAPAAKPVQPEQKPMLPAMKTVPVLPPITLQVDKSGAVVKPAPKPASPPAPQVATGAPRTLGGAIPAPAAAMAPPPARPAPTPAAAPAAAPATGSYVLQIGAYKSQAEADAAWRTYQGRHAALLNGFSQNVQQADLGAKGTWYRLRIAGFANREGAVALCERLKADGGACFLGR